MHETYGGHVKMKTKKKTPLRAFTLHNPVDSRSRDGRPLGSLVNFHPQTHMEEGVLLDSVVVKESYSDGTVISHKEVSTEQGRLMWADFSARGWTTSR